MAIAVGSPAWLFASWRRAIGAEEAAVQAAFEAQAVTPAERNQLQHHLRDERAWLSDFGRKWNWGAGTGRRTPRRQAVH